MERWKDVAFSKEEGVELIVLEEDCLKESDAWLIGRLATQSVYNVRAFKNTMMNVWKPRHGMEIHDIGRNLFSFRFFSAKDRDFVLKESPWNFDRSLVVLKEMNPNKNPNEEDLKEALFWVRIYDLPIALRVDSIAKMIGNTIGSFVRWDSSDDQKFGSSIRVRVNMDITKALRRGMMIKRGDRAPIKIFFKYERVGNFCYCCGRLDHTMKECDENDAASSDEDTDNLPYGPWLRAVPNRFTGVVGGRHDDLNTGSKKSTKKSDKIVVDSHDRVAIADTAPDKYEQPNPDVIQVLESLTKCQLHQAQDTTLTVTNEEEELLAIAPKLGEKDGQKEVVEVEAVGGTQSISGLITMNQHTKGECATNSNTGKSWIRRARSQRSHVEVPEQLVEYGYSGVMGVNCRGEGKRHAGGLAVIWKNSLDVNIISYCENHITMKINLIAEGISFLLSGIYGFPENSNKERTWQLMNSLKPESRTPWLCMRDFNEVLCMEDKAGGNPVDIQNMLAFKTTLVECELLDLGFVGYRYTWSNGQAEPHCIEE
ncbi:Zinc knuckle CX2CX4HX4C [Sesbania bispinosa]|nr:Zinc knuckle CX2CX4HX4C [Sesbania bispinosa]